MSAVTHETMFLEELYVHDVGSFGSGTYVSAEILPEDVLRIFQNDDDVHCVDVTKRTTRKFSYQYTRVTTNVDI